MPIDPNTPLADLLAQGLTPQQIVQQVAVIQEEERLASSTAQFPTGILPTDQLQDLSEVWLPSFAAFCDGEEASADYASAAAIVRDTIRDIAALGTSPDRLVAMIRGVALLYRRVMVATPHLRNQ